MAKGGKFELKIAKSLSLWFSKGERDDLVCRTDSSGGRATVRSAKNKKTNLYWYGDLKHSDDIAKPMFDAWSVECKTGYSRKNKKSVTKWDLLDLIDSMKKPTVFEEMWEQCKRDADLSGRHPVLIFGRSLRFPCIALDYHYFMNIVCKTDVSKRTCLGVTLANGESIVVMNLNAFLNMFPEPEKLFIKL
jgi:hypothetical protein